MEFDFSLGGLLGTIAGTVVAALIYGPIAVRIERYLRARPRDPAAGRDLEEDVSLMRYGLFALVILMCGGIGYWIGEWVGDRIGG